MRKILEVQTGEVKAGKGDVWLEVNGIGSCVIIAAYDATTNVGALAHIMLPGKSPPGEIFQKTKYAEDAIDELLSRMYQLGAERHNIEVSLVGGGNVLKRDDDGICNDNLSSIIQILEKLQINVKEKAIGGTLRRNVSFDIESGCLFYEEGDGNRRLLWDSRNKCREIDKRKEEMQNNEINIEDDASFNASEKAAATCSADPKDAEHTDHSNSCTDTAAEIAARLIALVPEDNELLIKELKHFIAAERQESTELKRSKKAMMNILEELEEKNDEIQKSNYAFLNLLEDMELAYGKLEESIEREKKLAAAAATAEIEKQRSNELEKAYIELKETTAQLIQSEKLSAMGQLVAGIAHEMNQPLNNIKIICQSILLDIRKDRYNHEETVPNLNEIEAQVARMANIIDHIRVYSRHSAGTYMDRININDAVEQPFKLLMQQLKDNNIEVQKELSTEPLIIKGDTIRLEQVFMNLLINAKQALGNYLATRKRILIKTWKVAGEPLVAVEVSDNGPGIPPEIKESIFQPFFTTKPPGEGTGLGLSLSKRIVDEHNGKITVDSTIGEGTTFRVVLPKLKEDNE